MSRIDGIPQLRARWRWPCSQGTKAFSQLLDGRKCVRFEKKGRCNKNSWNAIIVSCQMGWSAHGRSHVQEINSSLIARINSEHNGDLRDDGGKQTSSSHREIFPTRPSMDFANLKKCRTRGSKGIMQTPCRTRRRHDAVAKKAQSKVRRHEEPAYSLVDDWEDYSGRIFCEIFRNLFWCALHCVSLYPDQTAVDSTGKITLICAAAAKIKANTSTASVIKNLQQGIITQLAIQTHS